jgi:predicted transcriptional regulator
MNVLLSIRPKHVKAIEQGTKKYEFRKVIFRRSVDRIYIYETSPTRQIVGYFEVGSIIEDCPDRLWSALHNDSGLSESDFLAYYGQSQHGFAIEIKNAVFFKTPIEPKDLSQDFIPPQSFRYFTETSIPANAKSLYGVDAEYP